MEYVNVKQAFLKDYGLSMEDSNGNKLTERKFCKNCNFIIGKNGCGKTRFLHMVENHAKDIFGGDTHVISLNFPNLVGKRGKLKEEYEKELKKGFDLFEMITQNRPDTMKEALNFMELRINAFFENLSDFRGHSWNSTPEDRARKVFSKLKKYLGDYVDIDWLVSWYSDPVSGIPASAKKYAVTPDNEDVKDIQKKFLEMSPGEQSAVYMALFLSMLSAAIENDSNRNHVILIDEPELHMHYSLLNKFINNMKDTFKDIPVWIASHSMLLMSEFTFNEIIYIEDSVIKPNNGVLYAKIDETMMGNHEKTHDLLLDIASWEYLDFVRHCACDAGSEFAKRNDPQFEKFREHLDEVLKKNNGKIKILDYGAGQGRFADMLAMNCDKTILSRIMYSTYYLRDDCKEKINGIFNNCKHFPGGKREKITGTYDIILLVNTLHEIPFSDWKSDFDVIYKQLDENGMCFFCEANVLRLGENIPECGFMVMSTNALDVLFNSAPTFTIETRNPPTKLSDDELVSWKKEHEGRYTSGEISKSDLKSMLENYDERIYPALERLKEDAYQMASDLKGDKTSSRKRAFYSVQYCNAETAIRFLKDNNITNTNVTPSESPLLMRIIEIYKIYETDKYSQLLYAWHCIVRCLPILFDNPDIYNKWDSEKREMIIGAIFFSLDYALCTAKRCTFNESHWSYLTFKSKNAVTHWLQCVEGQLKKDGSEYNAYMVRAVIELFNAATRIYDEGFEDLDDMVVSVHRNVFMAIDMQKLYEWDMFIKDMLHDMDMIKKGCAQVQSDSEPYDDGWQNCKDVLYNLKFERRFNAYEKMHKDRASIEVEEVRKRLYEPIERH